MTASTSYLFVYGTLLDRQNDFGDYLHKNCSFYIAGKIKGRLYDFGEYPGAVLDKDSDTCIHGKIFRIKEADEVLKKLDEYEGYGPDEEQPHLFVRKLVSVNAGGNTLNCWIYLYNRSVAGLVPVQGGEYHQ
ncbi:MAG TPA: gamma-glutamylcyclotransferase family protein [Mucilaginibacter sp.]|nr:gamma-glutamylcyclotransferase family protein [Mucilaginibacter sp.]